jgi:galactonate dehydratase
VKITAVKWFALTITARSVFVVKVETDAGISGLGEAGTVSREKALGGAIDHFAQFLVGMDPRRIEHIWQTLYRGQYFEGGTVLAAAASAVDIALWDILAKSLDVPVYQLLGGRSRDYVTCFGDAGTLADERCIEAAQELVRLGFRTVRFGPGMADDGWSQHCDGPYEPLESLELAAHWLHEARKALGASIQLGIDVHHRFSVAEAAMFCKKAEAANLMFVEEPIRSENPRAYAALRRMTDMPFAIGEEFSSKWAFLPFVEEGLTNFARIDLCNVGGFTEGKKVAGWCEAHHIDVIPHNPLGPVSTAACVHFCTVINNFAVLEPSGTFADYPSDLFPEGPVLDGDKYRVNETPGLGVILNEEALADYAFKHYEAPHWTRRDGAYTNW